MSRPKRRPLPPASNFSALLGCRVRSLRYDFERKIGKLHLAQGAEPLMTGVTQLFEAIDPQVDRIEVLDAGKLIATARVRTLERVQ